MSQSGRFSITIILFMSFWAEMSWAQRQLRQQVTRAIFEYFESSNRKVETIEVGSVSRLSGEEHVVRADVMAQAPFRQDTVPYLCGVFLLRKIEAGRVQWSITTLTCEPTGTPSGSGFESSPGFYDDEIWAWEQVRLRSR
ncbi:MAG: hypothetical protein ACK5Y2_11585 [Bdellovibrionales bacterium]